MLDKLKELGFTPKVLFSDEEEIIEIEYLHGKKLADSLEQTDCVAIGKEIGKKIRQIHDAGIIHGDLTTSNMILVSNIVYFIDFGLSFFSQKREDKAVDLHVLEEALESKHHTVSRKVFAAVKEAYGDQEVLQRLLEVELRGRNKKGS
ncbi:Kae1-associated serine/threonine protein kinase [Candidatus Woesearchaeota archaeon]|nr:Kae1-associated serine/threonine protein kinase [Candidatus Woesearchaeota archaeon]